MAPRSMPHRVVPPLLVVSAVLVVVFILVMLPRVVGVRAGAPLAAMTDRHAVIAVSCPYAPFFTPYGDGGTEWRLIAAALAQAGREPQSLFVSHEDAVRYAESGRVAGIWISDGMGVPENGFFLSAPLLERRFVIATPAASELNVERPADLAEIQVGVHPDIYRVLEPQLHELPPNAGGIRQIANHELLVSLLLTGRIDALITEHSVFYESLRRTPDEANPQQSVELHAIFKPVYPRILFKDQDLRDRFDEAWRRVTHTRDG